MNHKWVGSLRFGWAYGFAHNYCFVFLLLREFNFNVFQTYIVGHVHIERKIIRKPWSRNGHLLLALKAKNLAICKSICDYNPNPYGKIKIEPNLFAEEEKGRSAFPLRGSKRIGWQSWSEGEFYLFFYSQVLVQKTNPIPLLGDLIHLADFTLVTSKENEGGST